MELNRRERRQLKKQGVEVPKEPTLNIKVSELFKRQKLTPEMKVLIHQEINRQILENDKQFKIDSDSMYLWSLHTRWGFGPDRLRRAYLGLFTDYLNMRSRYETDTPYPERQKLKEIGVDVEAWYEELFDDEGNFKRPEEVELP